MKKSCLYFDKKYKCVSFIVHYKGLTLMCLLALYFFNLYTYYCVFYININIDGIVYIPFNHLMYKHLLNDTTQYMHYQLRIAELFFNLYFLIH